MRGRVPIAFVSAALFAVAVAFDPASVRPFVGPKLAVAVAAGALAPVVALASTGLARLPRAALVAFGSYAVALGVATALSLRPEVSLAGDFSRGMGFVTRVSLVAVALVVGSAVAADRAAAAWPLRAALAACAVAAAYAFVQLLRLDPLFDPSLLEETTRYGVTELRAVSTVGHANFVGHLLLFGTGAAVALAGTESSRAARVAALACGALAAAGVVASGARGAWVGLVAQAVAFAALAPFALGATLTRRRALALLLGTAALVAVGAVVARGPVGEEIAKRALAFRADAFTGSGRTVLWRDALPMVPRYALHGCGPEAFSLAFLPYQSADLTRAEPYALFDSSHDVLLDAAVTAGLAGAAAVLLIAVVAARSLVVSARRRPRGRERALELGVGLALLGAFVHGLFVFETIPTALFFYAFAAIAAGLAAEAGGGERRLPTWRVAAAALLLAASGVLLWPRLARTLRADRQAASAVELSSRGRLSDAVAFGRASVANGEALGPAPELRHLLARVYARAGEPSRPPAPDEAALLEDGLAELARALPHSTGPHLLHAEAADLHLRFGRVDAAEAELREAVAEAPAFWPARARLAALLLATGDRDGARREAEAALALNPESRDARATLAAASGGAP